MITKIQIKAVNEMCKLSKELNMSIDMNKIVDVVNKFAYIGGMKIVYPFVLFTADDVMDECPGKADVINEYRFRVMNANLFDTEDATYIECCKLYYLCKLFR